MAQRRNAYLRQYPELGSFPSREAARAAWRRAMRSVYRSGWFWLGILAMSGVLSVLAVVVYRAVPQARTFGPAVVGGIVGAATVVGGFRGFHRRIHRTLRQELISMGIPICLHCGYDLRGQAEARCSECGACFDATLLESHAAADDADG